MSQGFDNRVALVTGCGRMNGIGRAIALSLALTGVDVAVTDIEATGTRNISESDAAERAAGWMGLDTMVGEIKALGRRSIALTGDVGDEGDAERLVSQTIAQLGRLDVLVNNAGAPHGPDRGLTWEIPVSGFDEVMRVNTRGVFLMSRPLIRHLLKRREAGEFIAGRIVNIASGAGKRGLPERAAYCASKFGVIGLTQVMAQELGAEDITVNAICPGAVATARQASRVARAAEAQVKYDFINPAVPRTGTVEDIARAVLFVADPAASYITGQAINVDGGRLMS